MSESGAEKINSNYRSSIKYGPGDAPVVDDNVEDFLRAYNRTKHTDMPPSLPKDLLPPGPALRDELNMEGFSTSRVLMGMLIAAGILGILLLLFVAVKNL